MKKDHAKTALALDDLRNIARFDGYFSGVLKAIALLEAELKIGSQTPSAAGQKGVAL